MNEELLRFNNNQRYLIFDTETEGLNLIKSRPWQLSWCVAVGKNIIESQDRYIWWEDLQISDDAARVTGFSREIYERRAENPAIVLKDFETELNREDTIVLGQNILRFDVYILNTLRRILGRDSDFSYLPRIIDTLALAVAIQKGIQFDKSDRLAWMYRMTNLRDRKLKSKLETLLKHYDIPFDKNRLHDAIYDNKMTYQVFLKQIYDLEI